jgi:hypothetical protein
MSLSSPARRTSRPYLASLMTICAVALAATACVKDKKKDGDETEGKAPDRPVVETPVNAAKSERGVLEVSAAVRDDGVLLTIGKVPAGSTLECELDQKPLSDCRDNALFARPAAGDHKVEVTALKGGEIVAVGASRPFTITPSAEGGEDSEDKKHPLTMVLDQSTGRTFTNGAAVPMTKAFAVHFKFAAEPTKCKKTPVVSCSFGAKSSAFWTECDQASRSYTVNQDQIAAGLQYLSVRAQCDGDVGPVLQLFWYGVPENYKPLMLRAVADGKGRSVVNLVKADDCAESEQKFFCAPPNTDDWAACQNGNVFDSPAVNSQVRLSCGDERGPVLTFP